MSRGEPTVRKPHRDLAGYRCECRNSLTGGHTIVLDCKLAEQQGAGLVEDYVEEGGRYQVLCNEHGTVVHCTSMYLARSAMRDTTLFCDECREIDKLRRSASVGDGGERYPLGYMRGRGAS
jgi:hypothetical protein